MRPVPAYPLPIRTGAPRAILTRMLRKETDRQCQEKECKYLPIPPSIIPVFPDRPATRAAARPTPEPASF